MDQALDWLVVVLPTIVSLLGVLVTIEPVDSANRNTRRIWRIVLIAFGLIVSTLTYVQQDRQRKQALSDVKEFRERLSKQEEHSEAKLNGLTDQFKAFLEHKIPQPKTVIMPALPIQQGPVLSAEEIAAIVAKQLKNNQPPPPVTLPNPHKPCRGDDLGNCTDDELVDWSKPLLSHVEAIYSEYVKERNIFSNTTFKDRRKFMETYLLFQENTSARYLDCCSEDVLKFYKEMALRLGGGLQPKSLEDWTHDLTLQSKSQQHQDAVMMIGSHIISIRGDLSILPAELNIKRLDERSRSRTRGGI
jgi:hypothetical protein